MMARPKALIDWKQVGDLAMGGANATQIASHIGIDPDTLTKRCLRDNNVGLSAFLQKKRAKGDLMLHNKQFQVAMKGNTSMLIWLGKNRLDQKDRHDDGISPVDKKLDSLLELIRTTPVNDAVQQQTDPFLSASDPAI